MLDSATGAADAVTPDTAAPAPAPVAAAPVTEARISEKDMGKLAEKVSEAATPKSEAERVEKDAADLKEIQVKAFRRANKDRDDAGKFAKAEADNAKDAAKALAPDAAKPDAVKPNSATADTTDQKPVVGDKTTQAPPAPPDAKEVKAPQSWSPEKKAVWDALSPEAKDYVSQREQEAHKAISKFGQFAKGVEPIVKTLESYADTFKSKGLSYQEGVKQLLDAQRVLDRDPVAGIQALAESYGVNLGQSLSSQRDPAIHQLQKQVDQLTQELTEARSDRENRQQAELNTKQASIEKVISDFSKDKTDFTELEPDIIANIGLLQETHPELSHAERLTMAYERAQWANPKSRQGLIERQTREQDSKRLEDAKRHADNATRARSINVTSADGPIGDVDLDTLQRSAFRRANAR